MEMQPEAYLPCHEWSRLANSSARAVETTNGVHPSARLTMPATWLLFLFSAIARDLDRLTSNWVAAPLVQNSLMPPCTFLFTSSGSAPAVDPTAGAGRVTSPLAMSSPLLRSGKPKSHAR